MTGDGMVLSAYLKSHGDTVYLSRRLSDFVPIIPVTGLNDIHILARKQFALHFQQIHSQFGPTPRWASFLERKWKTQVSEACMKPTNSSMNEVRTYTNSATFILCTCTLSRAGLPH